jgi:hypothetical protein
MIDSISRKVAIRRLITAWTDNGWRDIDSTAVRVLEAHARHGSLKAAVSDRFCVINDCSTEEVAAAASLALSTAGVAPERPPLITPEAIDSFAQVKDVSAESVAGIARPLPIPEAEVKRAILGIVGEPESDADWGGERSDGFSTQVILDGERVATSFVLKGPAQSGEMTPARYGKNGDQIQRSFTQPASLHIVQANTRIAPSVHELLMGLVRNARHNGDPRAAGSVWDATDTARVLVAYGWINASDGAMLR